jgi:hypothetical protein
MHWRNEKRGTTVAVALVIAMAVLPLSCGSGQGSDAKIIPSSEFLAKAKPICEKGNAKIGKYYGYWGERARFHADSEEFMNKVAEKIVIPVTAQEVRELRALGLPEGREKKLKAFLAALEEGIEKGKKDRRTLRGSNYAFQRAFDMAESVGLVACFTG